VSLEASYVEVFGQDDEGELLLAVFRLPAVEPAEANWERQLFVRHPGGQTVTLMIRPVSAETGEVTEYSLQIAYEEASAQVAREEAAGVLRGLTAAVERGLTAMRRLLPVELWPRPREALASPTPPRGDRQELVVYVEELRALDVEPYIRIALRKQPKRHTVSFVLEPLVDPKHPGRPLEPQRGTIEIHLLRPTPKASVTARLGSRNAEDFRDFSPPETLDDYSEGEERQWQAEVTVAPGATWSPL
jgi:hypothetical protein